MDSPSPPPLPRRVRFTVLLAIAVVAAAYAWFLFRRGASYAGGSDSSGYLNSARLLAHGKLSEPVRTIPGLSPPVWNNYFYQSLGCNVDADSGRMVPSYPIGYPLHLLIASVIVGFEKCAKLVNAVNALVAGVLLFALGRQLGLARHWSLAGVALLWACPVWLFQSLQPMSDSVATTWGLLAIYGAVRAKDRPGWAVASGAGFAFAIMIRPTSVMLILPLLCVLGGSWRAWLRFALGGLPFAVGLGAYNFAVYGSIIESGYNHGGHNIFDAFEWQFLRGNLRHFAIWIPRLLSLPIALLALLGLPWIFRRSLRTGLLLVVWVAAFVGLYACYFCAGETWWYLRFLMPAFPAVILAGLLAMQMASDRLPGKLSWMVPTVLLVVCVGLQWRLARELHVTSVRDEERNYWLAATWVKENVPANAILLTWQSSGAALYYNTQPIVRWDLFQPTDFELLRRTANHLHRPVYASLFDIEEAQFHERFPGPWTAVAHPGNSTIWRLNDPTEREATR